MGQEMEDPEELRGYRYSFWFALGYNDGNEVWSVATSLNGSYEFYAAQLGAIDALHLDFGNRFVVDDIVLNVMSASYVLDALYVKAVPIAPAVWLFGTALIGMFGFSRRKI